MLLAFSDAIKLYSTFSFLAVRSSGGGLIQGKYYYNLKSISLVLVPNLAMVMGTGGRDPSASARKRLHPRPNKSLPSSDSSTFLFLFNLSAFSLIPILHHHLLLPPICAMLPAATKERRR
jgi:hypothetical protein